MPRAAENGLGVVLPKMIAVWAELSFNFVNLKYKKDTGMVHNSADNL